LARAAPTSFAVPSRVVILWADAGVARERSLAGHVALSLAIAHDPSVSLQPANAAIEPLEM
jgi:hypothetical protein